MDNQDFNTTSNDASINTSQNFDSQNQTDSLEQNQNEASHSVPLSSLIEERRKFQKQIDEEKSLRKRYEEVLSSLGQNNQGQKTNYQNIGNKNDIVDSVTAQYQNILKTYGHAAADNWLNQQAALLKGQQNSNKLQPENQNSSIQAENQSVIQEIQQKHKDIYSIPEVKQAIDAYLKLDMDPGKSLRSQGFPEAVEYISSIYKAGYNSALNLKSQNDNAKSRMGSSITSGTPSGSSGRTFTRADIASMNTETFAKHEKAIFEQMSKGLIK